MLNKNYISRVIYVCSNQANFAQCKITYPLLMYNKKKIETRIECKTIHHLDVHFLRAQGDLLAVVLQDKILSKFIEISNQNGISAGLAPPLIYVTVGIYHMAYILNIVLNYVLGISVGNYIRIEAVRWFQVLETDYMNQNVFYYAVPFFIHRFFCFLFFIPCSPSTPIFRLLSKRFFTNLFKVFWELI